MTEDLFTHVAKEHLKNRGPLADRLRPLRIDEVVGQKHLVGKDQPLRQLIETDKLSSLILWGPPGTGKTTIARVIARVTQQDFHEMSAVSASVKDVRELVAAAEIRLGEAGVGTILFLDEVHRFNKSQQDALLPSVESGLIVLIGATTENPYFEVNAPLLSRSTLFRLEPLDRDSIVELLMKGVEEEGVKADSEALDLLADRSAGDGRQALTSLEVASAIAIGRGEKKITLKDVEASLGAKAIRYGRDDHYDIISAFIKSIRGSDVDAGLYWLARMLKAGEDPRFVARRLVILASEDIGMADPTSLLIADSAARAVEFVGLPEAQLNLAQAVIHLATAPKSNRVTLALTSAIQDVSSPGEGRVPPHLRDAHYSGASSIGHGEGYEYPHNDPRGWVEQKYRPEEVESNIYYKPSQHGFEEQVLERMTGRKETTNTEVTPEGQN
ncbi:MAG: replication-associated recombination protein A [Actinomycetota bacterium]|nr:replication-associated recombination protein A [Actinomycetota bacterium]